MSRKIIFQSLNWKIKDVNNHLEEIKEVGFNTIQLSPLQGIKENNYDFWVYYQPINYKIGNNLGDKNDLIELCKKANNLGIKIIVDVVFHHVANYRNNDINSLVDKEILSIKDLWYQTSFYNIQNYDNDYECTHYSLGGLPALNLSSKELRKLQFNYLKELVECGVSGFRFDAMKHLASENNYFQEMKDFIGQNIIDNSYGECIDCSQTTLNYYNQYMKCGTNITVSKDNENLVIWVFSHDDELTFNKYIPDNVINSEFEFLYNNYKADILYYARKFNNSWKNLNLKKGKEKETTLNEGVKYEN